MKENLFSESLGGSDFSFYLCSVTQRAAASRGLLRRVADIDGILRPTKPFVGQAEGKGVYERYHSVLSNFAT